MKRPGGDVYNDMGRRAVDADAAAKGAASVDTGRMRAAGYITPSSEVDGAWDVVFPVDYSIYQDQGTRYMAGTHFLSGAGLQAALR